MFFRHNAWTLSSDSTVSSRNESLLFLLVRVSSITYSRRLVYFSFDCISFASLYIRFYFYKSIKLFSKENETDNQFHNPKTHAKKRTDRGWYKEGKKVINSFFLYIPLKKQWQILLSRLFSSPDMKYCSQQTSLKVKEKVLERFFILMKRKISWVITQLVSLFKLFSFKKRGNMDFFYM